MPNYIQCDETTGRLLRFHGSLNSRIAANRSDLVRVTIEDFPDLIQLADTPSGFDGIYENWPLWKVDAGTLREKTQEELDDEAAAAAQAQADAIVENLAAYKAALKDQFDRASDFTKLIAETLAEAIYDIDDRHRKGQAQVSLATLKSNIRDVVRAKLDALTEV